MEIDETEFLDDGKNYLFVKSKKTRNNQVLLDHIFIHLDDKDDFNFIAIYDSYKSNSPVAFFKLERISFPQKFIECEFSKAVLAEDHEWKRMKVGPVLPSKWRMEFQQLKDNYISNEKSKN